MSRRRLGLVAGGVALAAVFAYLCIPGHVLGTLFYNVSPPLFRQTVAWEQSSNALQQQNGQVLLGEIKNHISVCLIAAGIAFAACFPLGVISSRFRLVRTVATSIVGAARSIPGVAVIFLLYLSLGQGEIPGIITLTLLAAPPIFLNTVTGYADVDRAVVEAARGMGMNRAQIFARIETPLAATVVIAGLRIAMVELIASATILAYANFDTLGSQISYGIDDLNNFAHGYSTLLVGISLIAGMALTTEILLTLVQRAVAPVRR